MVLVYAFFLIILSILSGWAGGHYSSLWCPAGITLLGIIGIIIEYAGPRATRYGIFAASGIVIIMITWIAYLIAK